MKANVTEWANEISRFVVVMGRDFVSALRPVAVILSRMKANVTEWASEIG
jgi:hypothetical protein